MLTLAVAALYDVKHRLNLVDGRLGLLQDVPDGLYGSIGPTDGVDGQNHFTRLSGREVVGLKGWD